jgi:hypothetical protein
MIKRRKFRMIKSLGSDNPKVQISDNPKIQISDDPNVQISDDPEVQIQMTRKPKFQKLIRYVCGIEWGW